MIVIGNERFYTVPESAILLNTGEPIIRKHIREKLLRAEKIGRSSIISETELKSYIEKRKGKQNAQGHKNRQTEE